MELYLQQTIICDIYNYMDWNDLYKYKHTPDHIWKRMVDYYCSDSSFKLLINNQSPNITWSEKFLSVINSQLRLVGPGIRIIYDNRAFALLKVRQWKSLEYLNTDFRADREIVLNSIRYHPISLIWASYTLRDDNEIVSKAVTVNGLALICASLRLRNDRAIVILAIKQNGLALEHASDELRADLEIAKIAMAQTCFAIKFVHPHTPNYRNFILETVRNNRLIVPFINKPLFDDPEIMFEAVNHQGAALKYASDDLKQNKQFILKCVKANGRSLQFASDDLRRDRDIVLAAVKENTEALEFAMDDNFRSDREIKLSILRRHANRAYNAEL